MKLVLVSPTGLFSGAELVLVRVMEAARAQGFEVLVVAPPGPLHQRIGPVPVVTIPELKLPSGPKALSLARLTGRQLRAVVALRRAVSGADVVLVNGLLGLPALWPWRHRRRIVWLVHDVIVRPDRLAFLTAFGRVADLAVAVSRAVAGPLEARGVPTRVVPNGTTWPVAAHPGRDAVGTVVGMTAALTSWKGQHVLLEAAARLAHREAVVELMGAPFPKDEHYAESLRRRADQPDLVGRVRFLGRLEEPLERMRTWTVAVSASVEPEAGPLAPLEAMSIGLPMVGTDHGGTPEVLEGAGLLVPPDDPAALAAAIDRLLDDPVLWERMHRAGPERISRGLRVEDQMAALLELLGHA